jgi:hypothetical protein
VRASGQGEANAVHHGVSGALWKRIRVVPCDQVWRHERARGGLSRAADVQFRLEAIRPWVSTFDRPNFFNDGLRRAVVTPACDIGRERRPFIGEFEIHAVCHVESAVVPRPTGLADWAACSVLNEGYPRDGGFDDG